MYLLLVSFSSGNVRRVELYPPQSTHVTTKGNVFFHAQGQRMYVYDRTLPVEQQFYYQTLHKECIYGSFMGKVGDVPLDRGSFFPEGPDLLRSTMAKACENHIGYSIFDKPLEVTSTAEDSAALRGRETATSSRNKEEVKKEEHPQPVHKLLVFQRNLDRLLLAADTATERLRRALDWDVRLILHDEDEHPCTIYHDFNRADVVLTVHGYQAVGTLFMRENSHIVEIFNFRYFKPTYILLAGEMRVSHNWFQDEVPTSMSRMILSLISQDMCMSSGWCRDFARKDDVILTNKMFNDIITHIRSKAHHPTDGPGPVYIKPSPPPPTEEEKAAADEAKHIPFIPPM